MESTTQSGPDFVDGAELELTLRTALAEAIAQERRTDNHVMQLVAEGRQSAILDVAKQCGYDQARLWSSAYAQVPTELG